MEAQKIYVHHRIMHAGLSIYADESMLAIS